MTYNTVIGYQCFRILCCLHAETMVSYHIPTCCHNPEDNLNIHYHESLKSCKGILITQALRDVEGETTPYNLFRNISFPIQRTNDKSNLLSQQAPAKQHSFHFYEYVLQTEPVM